MAEKVMNNQNSKSTLADHAGHQSLDDVVAHGVFLGHTRVPLLNEGIQVVHDLPHQHAALTCTRNQDINDLAIVTAQGFQQEERLLGKERKDTFCIVQLACVVNL